MKDMIEKTIIKSREQSIQEEERELYGMGCCFVFYSLMIIKFSKLRRSAFERGEGRERGDLKEVLKERIWKKFQVRERRRRGGCGKGRARWCALVEKSFMTIKLFLEM